jgi:hypothetical protein
MWLTASTKGAGALIGSQFGLSNAADPSQLEGWAFDASATVADGVGFGGDISLSPTGVYQATLTAGFGAGGRGSAGAATNTNVIPICKN